MTTAHRDILQEVPPPPPLIERPEVMNFLLESIFCDLNYAMLQMAAITCAMQACSRYNADWTLYGFRHVLDDNSHAIRLGLRFSESMGLSETTRLKIEQIYDEFGRAKEKSRPVLSSQASYTNDERQLLKGCLEDWRELCRLSLKTMIDVTPAVKDRMSGGQAQNFPIILDFLREALSGNVRRVSRDGDIVLPRLIERRRSPRVALSEPCRIILKSKVAVPAMLMDASRHGLRVGCEHHLLENEQVHVELQDLRRLLAVVVRGEQNSYGLTLPIPLELTDRLLVQGARSGGW